MCLPGLRNQRSMGRRLVGFARWLQFQINRTFTWYAVTSSYPWRWVCHRAFVIACLAASSLSGDGRATRYDGIMASR